MKKILAIICIISISFLTACNLDGFAGDWEYDPHKSRGDSNYGKTIIDEVIRCFDEDDVDALVDMFSDEQKNKYNLERQIKKAMEVYNGKSVSCDVYSYETISSHVYYGYYSFKHSELEYRSVLMDSGEEYHISVCVTLVDDDEPSSLGLTDIIIRDANFRYDFEHTDSTLAIVGR